MCVLLFLEARKNLKAGTQKSLPSEGSDGSIQDSEAAEDEDASAGLGGSRVQGAGIRVWALGCRV